MNSVKIPPVSETKDYGTDWGETSIESRVAVNEPGKVDLAARVEGNTGSIQSERSHSEPIYTPGDPKPHAVVTLFTDVTERKKAEEERRFQHQLLKVLMELPQQAEHLEEEEIVRFALEKAEELTCSEISFALFVNGSSAGLEQITWSRRTLKHSPPKTNNPSPDQSELWTQTLLQQKPILVNDSAALALPGGQPGRVISLPVLENGRSVMLFGVANKTDPYSEQDVNAIQLVANLVWRLVQRKRQSVSLLRLATAVEQSAESVVITDTQGTIVYVNPAFENTTDYSSAEALGMNPRLLKSGLQDEEFYRQMWMNISRGEVWRGHFSNKRKDGTTFEEEATISPIRNNEGTVIYFVAVKRDVTREMHLEKQFIEAQKMEALGQLAGGVAHDYNNILAANMMQLELLLGQPGLSPEVRQALEDLMQGEKRAAKLTSQLLMFSRRQAMLKMPVDLSELLNDELKMLRRLIGEQIQLCVTAGPLDAWIEADAGMMEQVIMNLCINARDAMPGGGKLSLGIRLVDLALSPINSPETLPGSFICLSVTDTGCGMSEETQKRIFEPFFTTKEIGKGTGLGMATVYGIVKQHHGWIEVSSELGKGSEFRVYFPAIQSGNYSQESGGTPRTAEGTERILVVEDESHVRKALQAALKFNGYQVSEAVDGAEAIQEWSQRLDEIDVLLTDMIMPGGLTGLELAREFKQIKPGLPVVLISGYSNEMVESGISTQDGFVYLSKPCNSVTLTRAVRASIEGEISCH